MKYKVTIYYQTHVDVEVEAQNEDQARMLAYLEAGDDKYNQVLLKHLTAADYSETEEIEEG